MSKKPLVNLSESSMKNSSKPVACPLCKGEEGKIEDCKGCHGSGHVSVNKMNRLVHEA